MSSATTTATSLADFVTSALIASSTVMVWPARSPSLVGAWTAACSETRSSAVERELAGFELLEQQIERHDLGQRGRMADGVGIGRMQHLAGIGVDHDGGVRRVVASGACHARLRPRASAGIHSSNADNQKRNERDNAPTRPNGASRNSTHHRDVPVPSTARRLRERSTSLLPEKWASDDRHRTVCRRSCQTVKRDAVNIALHNPLDGYCAVHYM